MLKIEKIPISEIKENKKNPRTITEAQLEKLAKSLEAFPQMLEVRPIVVDKTGKIIGGNMRFAAAKKIGLTEVPVIRAESLTEEQVAEFIVKDNLPYGEWDIDELKTWDSDKLSEWGLELPKWAQPKEAREDNFDMPEMVQTEIKQGDLIQIGLHRLVCGNSADMEIVNKLMAGKQLDTVFTDPPYGVDIGAKNRMLNSFQKSGRNLSDIKDDALSPEDLKGKLLGVFRNIKAVMSDECTVFVTAPQGGGIGMMMMMMMMMAEAELTIRHVLIWKKNSPTFSMGRLDYDYQHEPILMTWGKRHKFYGQGQFKSSIWEIDKPRKSKLHPTMKPVELIANAILNHTQETEIVGDFFMGSGSTMLAAHQLNRKAYGVEIMPEYCQVIIDRMLAFDNNLPVMINGEPYQKQA